MSDIFDMKSMSPMLIAEQLEAFDSPDYLYELKLDGVRCLAYLGDGKTELRNKRNINVSHIYPEMYEMHHQAAGRCILDGELAVIKNGKPEFAEIQRRALMANQFKIKLASAKLPVSFTAFDILYLDGEVLTGLPLEERQERLHKAISESDRLPLSKVIEGHGKALFGLTVQHGLEGVVAKRKGSFYYSGKMTKDWIKFKNLQDEDFVVCGYIETPGAITRLVLGQYCGSDMVYKGHVTIGTSGESFRQITSLPVMSAPPFKARRGNESAIWVVPILVCAVKYMELSNGGSMRQPVFKGLRDDKSPFDCVVRDDDN